MTESLPPISIKIDDFTPEESPSMERKNRIIEAEAEAEKLNTRTRLIREIIKGTKEKILASFEENPWTLDINPLGQYAINHYDKKTLVGTHIRITKSGEIVRQYATQGPITENVPVPVTINVDELLANFTKRELAK